MEVRISEQLRQLATALIAGGGLGLWFDLLQLFRRSTRKTAGPLWDLLFLVTSAGVLFFLGQRSGAGMRLFFLCAAVGGFCLYFWGPHDFMSHLFSQAKHFLQIQLGKIKKSAVSIRKSYKNE